LVEKSVGGGGGGAGMITSSTGYPSWSAKALSSGGVPYWGASWCSLVFEKYPGLESSFAYWALGRQASAADFW